MPRRISITLLFTVLFAVVALFAATQAGAFSAPDGKCPEVEATNFECFVDEVAGYVVEIVPCFDDGRLVFPCPRSGNTRFEYKITAIGTKKIDYINLLTSVCTPELVIVSTSPPPIYRVHGRGRGHCEQVRKRSQFRQYAQGR